MPKQNPEQNCIITGWGKKPLTPKAAFRNAPICLGDNGEAIFETLNSVDYKRKVKQLGQLASRSCFVAYTDNTISTVIPLGNSEPYSMLDRADLDDLVELSDYQRLLTDRDLESDKIAIRKDIALLVYPQNNFTTNQRGRQVITPSHNDVELLERVDSHSPGGSVVLVDQVEDLTYMTICRIDQKSNFRPQLYNLGRTACQELTWQSIFSSGVGIAEVNLNGDQAAYKRQIYEAADVLTKPIL